MKACTPHDGLILSPKNAGFSGKAPSIAWKNFCEISKYVTHYQVSTEKRFLAPL
jgi:hypothetical protein